MKVVFVAPAKRELLAASTFYDTRGSGRGSRFLDEVEAALVLVREYPTAWPIKYAGDIRQIQLRRFPYAIVYRVEGTTSIVLAIAHLRRRPAYWKRRSG